MSKIKIKTELKNNNKIINQQETEGIRTENTIKYTNDGIEIMDIENLILCRKTKEHKTIIDFKKETIKIINNNLEIEIRIKTKNIKQQQHGLEIKYEIIDTKDIYEYRIIWR